MDQTAVVPAPAQAPWSQLIPPGEWTLYRLILKTAVARQLPFAIGGGFAFSHLARRWRNTKDIDLYVLPEHREAFIELLGTLGFEDYFGKAPYDRAWIYRSIREGVICDVIFAMANQRAKVDAAWLSRAELVGVHDLTVPILSPEDLLWAKLYVLQRDRCDWPDLLNLLSVQAATLDWGYLLLRVGADRPVLTGLVSVFAWLCPAEAKRLPATLWAQLGLAPPAAGPDCQVDPSRVRLLDTRDWFGPTMEK